MKAFPKTIEVLKKICNKVHNVKESVSTPITVYKVSKKQWNWLMSVHRQEGGELSAAGQHSINDGDIWYDMKSKEYFNVPHYIPNRESYGTYYLIDSFVNADLTKNMKEKFPQDIEKKEWAVFEIPTKQAFRFAGKKAEQVTQPMENSEANKHCEHLNQCGYFNEMISCYTVQRIS